MQFGIEGYLVMLVGNRAPYQTVRKPDAQESARWKRHIDDYAAQARASMNAREALAFVRSPGWRWIDDPPRKSPPAAASANA